MSTSARIVALIWPVSILSGIALSTSLVWPSTADSQTAIQKAASAPIQKWSRVSVELPASQTLFPPGAGADLANAQCLMCHSAGMVLRQPALTQEEWSAVINKMRDAYGAPLPADQVDLLARYLHSINDRQSQGGPNVSDEQGN